MEPAATPHLNIECARICPLYRGHYSACMRHWGEQYRKGGVYHTLTLALLPEEARPEPCRHGESASLAG
jgi:hypothetical protein